MLHVAYQARLSRPVGDGKFSERDELAQRARRLHEQRGADHPSTVAAFDELEGPPAPDALGYLLGWFHEVFGRSGTTDHGLAPLSFTTIRDWARLTARRPQPHEVHALLRLDDVKRNPALMEVADG